MKLERCLQILKPFKPKAEKEFGVTKLIIFGSVARGEENENSDVDICFETNEVDLFKTIQLKNELEKLLGCAVDLIRMRNRINLSLKERIEKDGICI